MHKVEEQAKTINSDEELTRRGYVDTSNHLKGDIMQPRSQPVTQLEIAEEQPNNEKGQNDSRCLLGSPQLSKTLKKDKVGLSQDGHLSSVDNSELFQIQGLNTSCNNSNVCGAKNVYIKKSSRRQPRMLANNLISSIKIDGRTKMIVQESSLGHV